MKKNLINSANSANKYSSKNTLIFYKIILITSLFWVLVDVFVLFYLINGFQKEEAKFQPIAKKIYNLNKRDILGRRDDDNFDKNLKQFKTEKVTETSTENYLTTLYEKTLNDIEVIETTLTNSKEIDSEQEDVDSVLEQPSFINQSQQFFHEDYSNRPSNPSNWPGEDGHAVIIPEELKLESKKRFKENQFNIVASELTALNRTVPDQRSEACRLKKYPVDLPTTSIIIVFHNEGKTTLLRGLTSLIRNSPIQYIKEIILVDDASEARDYLHDELDTFLETLPVKTKIFRNKERLGLIRARLVGASAAIGDTMTFLDAHIEATRGWLPPLLNEIKINRLI